MSSSERSEVELAREGGVLTLTLCRRDKKNALTLGMYEALGAGLDQAEHDAGIRVVVLRGQDDLFTAGNDLGTFKDDPPRDLDTPVGRFLLGLARFPKPLVAAVAGPAIGVGTTLLLHCDLVYAGTNAIFQLPFTRLGLCPEAASTVLLPWLAGRVRASEVLLLGERFGPERARELGLVNAVLDPSSVLDHAAHKAAELAELPPAAVRLTKQLILEGRASGVEAAMRREATHFFERLQSPEAKEAMQAFFERRTPDFSRFS